MATRPLATCATDEQKREYLFKIIVIGESGTGKTSVVKQSVRRFFCTPSKATIGLDFEVKTVKYDDDTVVRLQLWDIAGQERFGNITRVFYKDAVGCIIVFDVSRPSTFDTVAKWKTDFDNKVQLPNGDPVPCILLANKCDLPKDDFVNNAEQMNEYCREKHFSKWFETSARENINIEASSQYLTKEIMKHANEPGVNLLEKPRPSFSEPATDNGSGGCCG